MAEEKEAGYRYFRIRNRETGNVFYESFGGLAEAEAYRESHPNCDVEEVGHGDSPLQFLTE